MAATRQDVDRWIQTAKKDGMKYIISVCDTFDYDDYPVFCKDEEELSVKRVKYDGTNMQRINEIIKIEEEKVTEDLSLSNILDKLSGRSKPTEYKVAFVISSFNDPQFIDGDIKWLIDEIGTSYLEDIISNKKSIPTEIGAYSASLWVHSFQCNHPEDPTEWDLNIWLENIKKIELKYD